MFIDVDDLVELRNELTALINHCNELSTNMEDKVNDLIRQGYARDDIIAIMSIAYGDKGM